MHTRQPNPSLFPQLPAGLTAFLTEGGTGLPYSKADLGAVRESAATTLPEEC